MQQQYEISEIEILYKSKISLKDSPKILTSEAAHAILRTLYDENTIELFESAFLLLLNRANQVRGYRMSSMGATTGVLLDPRIIFVIMLKTNSYGCVICHNHPSGNAKPSNSDIQMTEKLAQGAKLLDLKIMDHIILCADNVYFSFADEGL